jgi:cytochrome c-type biogenesis protein CcmE
MKRKHIIAIVFVVIAIGVVISLFYNSSTYSDFSAAASYPGRELHIIGTLDKTKPILYDSLNNVNEFSFYMNDQKGMNRLVIYKGAKPQDFEKSEQVVVTGMADGDNFKASKLLLKCPSKYNEEKKPKQFGDKEFGSKEEAGKK